MIEIKLYSLYKEEKNGKKFIGNFLSNSDALAASTSLMMNGKIGLTSQLFIEELNIKTENGIEDLDKYEVEVYKNFDEFTLDFKLKR